MCFSLSRIVCDLFRFRYLTHPVAIQNRGDASRRNFQFTVKFFVSKAKLGDGSVRNIERDTLVRWEVEFTEIDPQELQILEEKAVKNVVEKLGESVLWGPEQEVALLRFDNWKGEYVRIEDGEDLVSEIDRKMVGQANMQPFMQSLLI